MQQNYEGGLRIERMKSHIPWDMAEVHSHNYHEIYYLLSGKRRYFVGHSIYDVEEGDLVIIPKNTLHRTNRRGGESYERYVVYFSDEFLEPLMRVLGEKEKQRFLELGSIQIPKQYRPEIRKILETMEHESGRNDAYVSLSSLCALGSLIAIALRYGTAVKSGVSDDGGKILEVTRYICENFHQEITLSDVAKRAYMEETYFSKQFKKLTGFGFSEYVSQVRMQQATELLRNSKLSVSKIAELCGYSSGNYFGDAFRKQKGMSPTEYRKKYR